ncbi:ftsX domain protein [Ruminococcus sp. CAG:563]|nr:ftsX domain protein [Ruminococcus sp. CAG:563]
MKKGFYPKLAFDGIRKNKKMYLPYILTSIGMVMMYYIIIFLQFSQSIKDAVQSSTVSQILGLGSWVIAIFSCIFLFYTNSFLIKRRKKEFGLYNILGMDKHNLGIILFWETLIIAAISLVIGLAAGIAFSKLAELVFLNLLKSDATFDLTVSSQGIGLCAIIFTVINILLFFNSLRQVRSSSAISLVKSEQTGEKPPKGNRLLGILGVLLLGGAYYISLSIKEPLQALTLFFVAVIMVIIGTYLVMISGSVLFCRLLQKNKKYYYKPNHFVSVSSMVYRMKRNGAGLASICILATMVLVMISSTTSLYFGAEDALSSRYPREINISFSSLDTQIYKNGQSDQIRSGIDEIAKKHNANVHNSLTYLAGVLSGMVTDGNVETDIRNVYSGTVDYNKVFQFNFVSVDDYNEMMGTDYRLKDGEAMVYLFRKDSNFHGDTLSFNGGQSFKIVRYLDNFISQSDAAMTVVPTMAIFVNDLDKATQGMTDATHQHDSEPVVNFSWTYGFDTGLSEDEQIALSKDINSYLTDVSDDLKEDIHSTEVESREQNRLDFFGLYGGLFGLGIILSIVFIFAAVLIIYYKQISEGYEDQSRFEIMQKVGMTKNEIRKSINSQLLTVFFLPLIFAGMHLAFAAPIIKKLLLLFNLTNLNLFIVTILISFAAFALFYMIVYKITSSAYYKIVSGAKEG